MALGGKRFSLGFSSLLMWRIVLGAALLACIIAGSTLWFSGGSETKEAVMDGRRIIVDLQTKKIQGKLIDSDVLLNKSPEPVKEELPAEKTEDPKPDEPPANQMPVSEESLLEETPAEQPPVEVQQEPAPAKTPTEAAAPPEMQEETQFPEEMPPSEPLAETPAETSMETSAPEVSLPEQPIPEAPQEETGPVAPIPLAYDDMPGVSVPQLQSSAPSVLPSTAPMPPLSGEPVPEIMPSDKKPPEMNSLLTEKSEEGTIPKIAADGTRAWKYYAKPFTRESRKPMIAIVITGLGQNKLVTEHALDLPENITLAFSPYATQVENWTRSARLAGHESMLELPLEPADYPSTDPGPRGLLLGKGTQENEGNLRWLMARLPTSIGFVTPRNEKFSSSVEDFKLLLQILGNHGLMLMVTKEPAQAGTKALLDESSTPNIVADLPIDEELSPAVIRERLRTLEELAQKKGYAVGIAGSYPLTVAELKEWVKKLDEKGIILVPLSAIAKLDYS